MSLGDAWQKSQELIALLRYGRHRRRTGVGLGVVFNHALFALLVAARDGRHPRCPRQPAGRQHPDSDRRHRCLPHLANRRARIRRRCDPPPLPPAELSRFAGLLVLLQLALIYFVNALTWAGEPMFRARLGSIVPLQLCFTPARIKCCLDRWCTMLRGHAGTSCTMSAVVREALFRDIIGFIPVYSAVFTFGLWFGVSQLGWAWLETVWWALPLTALVADYGEDLCHLSCLRLHQKGTTAVDPSGRPWGRHDLRSSSPRSLPRGH